MNRVIYFFIAIICIVFSNPAIAQERTVSPNLSFISASATLSKATGWTYMNTDNQWHSYDKLIPYRTYCDGCGYRYNKSHSSQSFENLIFKKINTNGTDYYILFSNRISGAYKYPSIKEDWEEYNITEFYVFSKEQYIRLFNNTGNYDTINIICQGTAIDRYDNKLTDNEIIIKINKELNKKHYSSYSLCMLIKKSDDGKYMRFQLPSHYDSYVRYSKKEYDGVWDRLYEYNNLKKSYFETELSEWTKLGTLI